ncbi:MAG: hypothetical protein BGO37_00810 [Cellulomonas sp. 73-92]|uniref:DUF2510 domain-containing protein n=1 Tax=Cellulomonas sp. 73-92 TaxID=1895740 RepID=UPI00092A260A|nr:DUF2510 domain-containing protein [Cellulomonas sp. 73-92]OJV78930.1 MAG: hypothetical protein BGO37_00810 [Cellulomonas sp. 73-92]
MSSATPPGWYPDPWGRAARRYWDGTQWTPQLSGEGGAGRPRLPGSARIYGDSIWLLALLPILSTATIWLMHVDVSSLTAYIRANEQLQASGGTPTTFYNPYSMFGPGYTVAVLLGLLLQATLIVLAYRDRQYLGRLGVQRPFHWAWAFLGAIVYVVGRSVVVHKVAAPRGYAPMWAAIATYAVALVSGGIWAAVLIVSLTQQFSTQLG